MFLFYWTKNVPSVLQHSEITCFCSMAYKMSLLCCSIMLLHVSVLGDIKCPGCVAVERFYFSVLWDNVCLYGRQSSLEIMHVKEMFYTTYQNDLLICCMVRFFVSFLWDEKCLIYLLQYIVKIKHRLLLEQSGKLTCLLLLIK